MAGGSFGVPRPPRFGAAGCRLLTDLSFTFFSHTGDIGIAVTARTLDELFGDAAAALTETITDHRMVAAARSVPVQLRSSALDLLLVDWLNDLVYRFDTEGFLAASANITVAPEGAGWSVVGAIGGEALDPRRHPVRVLVKAATYHALDVRRTSEGWMARVVIDV